MDENYTPEMPMVAKTDENAQTAQTPQDDGTIGGGITDINKPTVDKPKSKKPLIIVILLVLLIGLGVGGFFLITTLIANGKKEDFIKIATSLTDKIKESEKNQVIYLYDDLKKLDSDFGKSPYDKDISNKSYIYYNGEKPVVCLSDGENRVISNDDEIKYEKSKDGCEFKLDDSVARAYAEAYYINKGMKIDTSKTSKVRSHFAISTDDGTIYSNVSYKNGKIEVEDDTKYNGNINSLGEAVEAISWYTENILGIKIESGSEIFNIEYDSFIYIQSSQQYETALDYTEKIDKYLMDKKPADMIVGVGAIGVENGEYINLFLIRIYIKNGQSVVQTLIKDGEKVLQ